MGLLLVDELHDIMAGWEKMEKMCRHLAINVSRPARNFFLCALSTRLIFLVPVHVRKLTNDVGTLTTTDSAKKNETNDVWNPDVKWEDPSVLIASGAAAKLISK